MLMRAESRDLQVAPEEAETPVHKVTGPGPGPGPGTGTETRTETRTTTGIETRRETRTEDSSIFYHPERDLPAAVHKVTAPKTRTKDWDQDRDQDQIHDRDQDRGQDRGPALEQVAAACGPGFVWEDHGRTWSWFHVETDKVCAGLVWLCVDLLPVHQRTVLVWLRSPGGLGGLRSPGGLGGLRSALSQIQGLVLQGPRSGFSQTFHQLKKPRTHQDPGGPWFVQDSQRTQDLEEPVPLKVLVQMGPEPFNPAEPGLRPLGGGGLIQDVSVLCSPPDAATAPPSGREEELHLSQNLRTWSSGPGPGAEDLDLELRTRGSGAQDLDLELRTWS
ncbi:uncharacterized protein V6R79_007217 [Siganus canaliculatus]